MFESRETNRRLSKRHSKWETESAKAVVKTIFSNNSEAKNLTIKPLNRVVNDIFYSILPSLSSGHWSDGRQTEGKPYNYHTIAPMLSIITMITLLINHLSCKAIKNYSIDDIPGNEIKEISYNTDKLTDNPISKHKSNRLPIRKRCN